MSIATDLTGYLICENIDDVGIQAVSGALLHNLCIDVPIPREKFAEVVEESRIPLNIVPDGPIVKMARKEHVDAFFRDGTLRLGSFYYYNAFDHEEIGDPSEGAFVLVGQSPSRTAFAKIRGGFNYYVFCCYHGDADKACIERFGYDSSFTIVNVEAFSSAVQTFIGAVDSRFSKCVYRRDKVVVGNVATGFDFNTMSARLLDLASEAKYFVKPNVYAHQSEFRFLWQAPSDVTMPLDVKIPEAIRYCRR